MNAVDKYVLKTRQMLASRPHSDETEGRFCDELDVLWWAMTQEQQKESEEKVGDDMDILSMDKPRLEEEIRKLRAGIRMHRDSSGHDLCWFHPELWNLLPEKEVPQPKVPPTEEFLQCCVKYRKSLDEGYDVP